MVTAAPNAPKKKGRPAKQVEYPLFVRLSEYTLDDYWKQILLACGMGRFPRCVSYKDDQLVHRRGRVAKSITLLASTAEAEDFHRVLEFFRTLGMCSVLDNEANRKRVEDERMNGQAQPYEQWKDIKRPQTKDILLQTYTNELYDRYKLTTKEYQHLQSTISIACLFKYISASTVILADGKIKEITGLLVEGEERGKRKFSFPFSTEISGSVSPSPMLREEPEQPDQSKNLAAGWMKYCDDLKRSQAYYDAIPRVARC